jgi:hypothetical protein
LRHNVVSTSIWLMAFFAALFGVNVFIVVDGTPFAKQLIWSTIALSSCFVVFMIIGLIALRLDRLDRLDDDRLRSTFMYFIRVRQNLMAQLEYERSWNVCTSYFAELLATNQRLMYSNQVLWLLTSSQQRQLKRLVQNARKYREGVAYSPEAHLLLRRAVSLMLIFQIHTTPQGVVRSHVAYLWLLRTTRRLADDLDPVIADKVEQPEEKSTSADD